MINEITGLISRTDELEKYLEKFEKQQSKSSKKNVCLDFSKNFSNLEIVLPKKILIAKLEAQRGESIFIQAIVDFSLSASETVEFSLSVNDISIYKAKKILQNGSNQISIMSSFVPITSEVIDIYITITPKHQKQLLLTMVTMFVWGNFDKKTNCLYEVIETNEKYFLTILYNDIIYYKIADKINEEYSFSDFSYFTPAIDYSIMYDSENDKVLLLRVDENGNLFYSNFLSTNETFIASGVQRVSAAICASSGEIMVAIIANKKCKFFELNSNGDTSSIRDIKCGNSAPSDCYVFYNNFRQKFCVVISSDNFSNYYVEQIDETSSNIENISVSYSIDVSLVNNQ